jgi:uncharacterized membrane protein YeaQ/YmgE (transglycosylase-associated protein family)
MAGIAAVSAILALMGLMLGLIFLLIMRALALSGQWRPEVMMEYQMGFMAMPGLGFFGLLLVGLIAGYVAERAMNRDHGLLTNMLVGIAGSFVGGALAGVLNINYYGFAGNLVVAIIGAILILWLFGRSKRG